MPADQRSERRRALERANRVRAARARLRRKIREGADLAEILIDPPPEVQAAKVIDLLLALPGWGRVLVNRVLMRGRIPTTKTVGGLSDRQRYELVAWLRWPPQGVEGQL